MSDSKGMDDDQFNNPDGVTIDPSGNVYVSDGRNQVLVMKYC